MLSPEEQMAIQEAKRRMSGQPASGAGTGMPAMNAMMPTQNLQSTQQQPNPMQQFAQGQQSQPIAQPVNPMQRFQNPNMSAQTEALDTGKPDQTTMVLKSLIKFLDKSTGEQQAQGMA